MKRKYTAEEKLDIVMEAMKANDIEFVLEKYSLNKNQLTKLIEDLDDLEEGSLLSLKYDIAIAEGVVERLNSTIYTTKEAIKTLEQTIKMNFKVDEANKKLEQAEKQLSELESFKKEQLTLLYEAKKELEDRERADGFIVEGIEK